MKFHINIHPNLHKKKIKYKQKGQMGTFEETKSIIKSKIQGNDLSKFTSIILK